MTKMAGKTKSTDEKDKQEVTKMISSSETQKEGGERVRIIFPYPGVGPPLSRLKTCLGLSR